MLGNRFARLSIDAPMSEKWRSVRRYSSKPSSLGKALQSKCRNSPKTGLYEYRSRILCSLFQHSRTLPHCDCHFLLVARLKLHPASPPRPVVATTIMSALQSAELNGREYATQLDNDDPLKSFRKEFLIPTKIGSGMSLPILKPAPYTNWQLQTVTMAMEPAFIFAETR